MSTTIDQSFVRQYESEVKLAYQRFGSKFRDTVRTRNGVRGASTTFQKVGKGEATTKTRHGEVTPMNLEHTPVECLLSDWYAGEYVDKLDELKINHDERAVAVRSGAAGLGRKTDSLIITALSGTSINVGDYSTGLTRKLVLDAREALASRDVSFDDGMVFCAVSNHGWGELMSLEEFSNADYVGSDGLPWKDGRQYRHWMGVNWFEHSGLPLANTDDRDLFMYHHDAVGHAIGAEVMTDITWQGTRAAHFVNNMMSQGAVIIDGAGVVKIRVDDDAAYT